MPANRPGWGLLSRRSVQTRTASELYGRLVAQARAAPFYADLGVADTPEGRLELVMLHVVVMLRRLQREGESAALLARALSETFVTDMDDCMREMGVGDMMVARKVKRAAAALFDRARDYGAALDKADRTELAQLVCRHVLAADEGLAVAPHAAKIADYVVVAEAALGAASIDAIVAGEAGIAAVAP